MGWKTLKERYRIEHIVSVTDKGICIGSPYIHDLIVIGLDGAIIKGCETDSNADLKRYMDEMRADPEKLRDAVKTEDKFLSVVPVYTYRGGSIIEKKCEIPGWPHATTDGELMYDNTFSTDRRKVVQWAKENARAGIELANRRIEEVKAHLKELELILEQSKRDLEKLDKENQSRADRWESACASATQIAPGSDGVLMVDGYVAGLRSAEKYARELELLLQAALDCKPSDLGDWKREARRKFPRLAAR